MKYDQQYFMQQCLDLALKGAYLTSPNPMVGALIVKNNEIISTGYHQEFGGPHAEVHALKPLLEQKIDLLDATLYCSLEPCCHSNKKTPPCTELIIQSGIKNVVIAATDANPQVAGLGIKKLKEHGIHVTTGVLEESAKELNRAFFHRIQTQQPYVILKWAQSLDGKMALENGESKWISNEASRANVHLERLKSDVIITCGGTLRKDDPQLTARYQDFASKTPWRVIVTASGEIDHSSQIFKNLPEKIAIITRAQNAQKLQWATDLGVKLLIVKSSNNQQLISAQQILSCVYELGQFNQIFVEAGPTLLSEFIQSRSLHELQIYMAPMLIGAGVTPTERIKITELKDSLKFKQCLWKDLAGDLYFRGIIS